MSLNCGFLTPAFLPFLLFLSMPVIFCFRLWPPLSPFPLHSTLMSRSIVSFVQYLNKCAKRNPSTMEGWKKKKHSNQTTNQRICCAKFASHYTIHCFVFTRVLGLLGFSLLTLRSLNFVCAKCSMALFVYNALMLLLLLW